MQAIGTAPPMTVSTDDEQHTIISDRAAKTPDDFIEEAVKLQDAACILVAARIGRIAGITITPQKMLRGIKRIQLDQEKVPRLAMKQFQRHSRLLQCTRLQFVAKCFQVARRRYAHRISPCNFRAGKWLRQHHAVDLFGRNGQQRIHDADTFPRRLAPLQNVSTTDRDAPRECSEYLFPSIPWDSLGKTGHPHEVSLLVR